MEKNPLKALGGGLLAIGVLALVILAVILLVSFGTKVAFSIQPFFSWLAGVLFLVDLIYIPFAVINKKSRAKIGKLIVATSFVFGIAAWLYGFAVTVTFWGFLGLLIGLLFAGVGVVPIGLLAALFHAQWGIFFGLLSLAVMGIVARVVGTAFVLDQPLSKMRGMGLGMVMKAGRRGRTRAGRPTAPSQRSGSVDVEPLSVTHKPNKPTDS